MKTSTCNFARVTSKSSEKRWIYVTNGSQLIRQLNELMISGRLVALDIETTGLNPWQDEILLVQLGTRTKTLVIDFKKIGVAKKHLAPLLASDRFGKLGHNLAFDCAFLEVNGLRVRGPLCDTFLASKILTAGLPETKGLNGLGACVKRALNVELENKDELQKSFIGHQGAFSDEQLDYAAQDVGDLVFDLYEAFKVQTTGQDLLHVWQLECRALPALIQMYVNGFKLNVDYYKELLVEESEFREKKKLEVIEYLNNHGVLEEYKCPLTGKLLIHPEYSGKGKGKTKGFNLASPAQLGDVLAMVGVPLKAKVNEKTGKTSYSCDKNILAFYLSDFEVLRLYKEYKNAATRTAMVEKLIGIAEDDTNHRIHARYNQMVRTGRMSCIDPNLQQIPKEKQYRKGFIAEPGNMLIICDYSQLEIRLVAEVSGDENLIDIYERGEDVHTGSAMLMTGKEADEITKEERSAAKAVNFGALYGCGAKTLRQQAISMFGILWSVEEAQEKLNQWKDAYPGVLKWQRRQGNSESLRVFTQFGRRRLLQPPKKNESNYTTNLNTPVQGLGADCMKAALAMLWEQHVKDDPTVQLVACVHDEIVLEAPHYRVDEVKSWLKECMEDAAPLVGITRVPIVAEPNAGPDWSDK